MPNARVSTLLLCVMCDHFAHFAIGVRLLLCRGPVGVGLLATKGAVGLGLLVAVSTGLVLFGLLAVDRGVRLLLGVG